MNKKISGRKILAGFILFFLMFQKVFASDMELGGFDIQIGAGEEDIFFQETENDNHTDDNMPGNEPEGEDNHTERDDNYTEEEAAWADSVNKSEDIQPEIEGDSGSIWTENESDTGENMTEDPIGTNESGIANDGGDFGITESAGNISLNPTKTEEKASQVKSSQKPPSTRPSPMDISAFVTVPVQKRGEELQRKKTFLQQKMYIKSWCMEYDSEGAKELPEITVDSQLGICILSLRWNRMEASWHWKENKILLDCVPGKGKNNLELLAVYRKEDKINISFSGGN